MQRKKILILAKTYPSPSAKYMETACVAGISEEGEMIRLYPVPFRLMEKSQQFKKYHWIECLLDKANHDHRHESHKILLSDDSPKIISHLEKWYQRMPIIEKIPTFNTFQELAKAQEKTGISLALLKPHTIQSLEISKEHEPHWSKEELDKLLHEQEQLDLFQQYQEAKNIPLLRKMPYQFHYHYTCQANNGTIQHEKHKIIDWEAGALYWNICQDVDWEQKFRQKYEQDFIQNHQIWFLMGNMHRFRTQFMIISVIAIPKPKPEQTATASLF